MDSDIGDTYLPLPIVGFFLSSLTNEIKLSIDFLQLHLHLKPTFFLISSMPAHMHQPYHHLVQPVLLRSMWKK